MQVVQEHIHRICLLHLFHGVFVPHAARACFTFQPTMARNAGSKSGYWKLYPSCTATSGSTRWPVVMTLPNSPRPARTKNLGTGSHDGRCKAGPSARQNMRIVTGSSDTALTA